MSTLLQLTHYDLVTPDGKITSIRLLNETTAEANVLIENISPAFVGFEIDNHLLFFNLKSALAQLGINSRDLEIVLDKKALRAQVKLELQAIGPIGREMLKYIQEGLLLGKIFAADERRRVRDPSYLSRMFGRSDRKGRPLLSLGGLQGSRELILEKIGGRTVAYLTLQNGKLNYDDSIFGFLPTVAKALIKDISVREMVGLHQVLDSKGARMTKENELLLLRTQPLHVRTVFGRVVNELLTEGFTHTSASVLQPDTQASGHIYELYGNSNLEITDIPLEFYTLEPYREYVFFSDRDQLQSCLEDDKVVFNAFKTAPESVEERTAVYIVKGTQLMNLKPEHWVSIRTQFQDFPGIVQGGRQGVMAERYIQQQPSYPFLKKISNGVITSQGVLFVRYFPSPLMKQMLLGVHVQNHLKGIYFQYPSMHYGNFFSSEDRALLNDLQTFGIPIYWVDEASKKILQYINKPHKDSGLFVPLNQVDTFMKSTVFGLYGSNFTAGNFEEELRVLFQGLQALKSTLKHPQMNAKTPLSLVTGGGPGSMELGNRIAKELGILSCANIVDFSQKNGAVVNEQFQNNFIEAKMTYRIDKLVERQAEFNLDFPIFLVGGIGTDFEYALEEVRRKVGAVGATPIILFGGVDYWREKITPRYQSNLHHGTIKGSEWISNCFYCVQNGKEALKVYQDFFSGTLPIGKLGPTYTDGFVVASSVVEQNHS